MEDGDRLHEGGEDKAPGREHLGAQGHAGEEAGWRAVDGEVHRQGPGVAADPPAGPEAGQGFSGCRPAERGRQRAGRPCGHVSSPGPASPAVAPCPCAPTPNCPWPPPLARAGPGRGNPGERQPCFPGHNPEDTATSRCRTPGHSLSVCCGPRPGRAATSGVCVSDYFPACGWPDSKAPSLSPHSSGPRTLRLTGGAGTGTARQADHGCRCNVGADSAGLPPGAMWGPTAAQLAPELTQRPTRFWALERDFNQRHRIPETRRTWPFGRGPALFSRRLPSEK